MDVNELNLCLGCMNELEPDGSCLNCSHNGNIPRIQPYLAAGTVLDNRYLVGRVLSYNGEGASYIGYDKVAHEKVVVREYLPDTFCTRSRGNDSVQVNPDCLAKYKTYMSEFAEKWYVLFFYFLNFIMVFADLILYFRNKKLDAQHEKSNV